MTSHAVPDIIELDAEQLDALLLRVEAGQLTPEDVETLIAALKSYAYVTRIKDSPVNGTSAPVFRLMSDS